MKNLPNKILQNTLLIAGLLLLNACGGNKSTKINNHTCSEHIVNVSDFGAVGDGVQDDYESIMRAVKSINTYGSGTLVFPKGVYRIDRHRIDAGNDKNNIENITFENLSCLSIQGNGATIDVDGDYTRTIDYTYTDSKSKEHSYSYHNAVGLKFVNSSHITITHINLDGNADKTTKEASVEGTSHGLSFYGCKHVTLDKVYVHHYQADGLYVASNHKTIDGSQRYFQSKHFTVKDSNFTNNARQGASLVQLRDAHFTHCIFSQTGKTGGYGGHAPMAGVDVEPNYSTNVDDNTGDITFKNCTFSDNVGFEYIGSNAKSTPYPIYFDACTFSNTSRDSNNSAVVPASAETHFKNCTFDEVGLFPNFGLDYNASIKVDVFQSNFKSTMPSQRVLLTAYPNVDLDVKYCSFDFNATTSSKETKRIYLQKSNATFENNTIFVSKAEHDGDSYNTKFLLQGGVQASGNQWQTDLNVSNTFFIISYAGGSSTSNYTLTPKRSFSQRDLSVP